MMQEVGPVMDVVISGYLVGNVAHDVDYAFLLPSQYGQERGIHLDGLSLETASHIQEETVENLVFQRMINLAALHVAMNTQRTDPLPVAVMPQIDRDRTPAGKILVQFVQPLKAHPSAHLFLTDRKQLDGFYDIVTEKGIKLLGDLLNLLWRLLRKGRFQIAVHHAFPVADHVIQQIIKQIGNPVKHPQWKKRNQIPECETNVISYIFHVIKLQNHPVCYKLHFMNKSPAAHGSIMNANVLILPLPVKRNA